MNYVQVLTQYKAWGDGLFLATVSRLPTAELTAPQPIVFGSLIRTLHHVYAVDYVWQCHLLGKPHGLATRNPADCPDIATLVAQQHQMDKWYVDYADSITDQTLAKVIGFDFIGGGRGAMSRRDIILHVVNHTTYHRGHVAGMLYRLNISPPTTDLPVFAREHAAAPGTVSVV